MSFVLGKYITPTGLKGLEQYHYHGLDRSLLAKYVFQPFWNRVVNLLPLWIAPNLVTLAGFFFIVLSYVLIYAYIPDLKGVAPSWVYYACAANLFIYQTLDAIDGKQARRTSSSSPLGELFDHGCDAVTTVLSALIIASTVQLGSGLLFYIFVLTCMITFFAKQWEEYHTSVFELGFVNVTEAQVMTMTVYALTGYLGPNFWLTKTQILGYTLQYNEIAISICFIGGLPTTLNSVIETVKFYLTKKQPQVSTPQEALYQLIPTLTVALFSYLWLSNSPYILHNHPHAMAISLGFVYCNLIGRIVLARVCKQTLGVFQPVVLPFVIGYLLSINPQLKIDQAYFLQVYAFAAVAAYLHFALSVIDTICKHLRIKCLSIPYKKST